MSTVNHRGNKRSVSYPLTVNVNYVSKLTLLTHLTWRGDKGMPTVYVRDFPEDLHLRLKIQVLKEKTTIRELVIKVLEEYLKKVGG